MINVLKVLALPWSDELTEKREFSLPRKTLFKKYFLIDDYNSNQFLSISINVRNPKMNPVLAHGQSLEHTYVSFGCDKCNNIILVHRSNNFDLFKFKCL